MICIQNNALNCFLYYIDLFPKSMWIANEKKKTPLMLASELGNEKMAEVLPSLHLRCY